MTATLRRAGLLLPCALLMLLSVPAAWSAGQSRSAKSAAIAESCRRFSAYDADRDGTAEITSLKLADLGRSAAPKSAVRDTVLVLAEARLLNPPAQADPVPDLRPHLATFAADLAAEGHDAFVVAADVYSGERHQDGRTVLALREFLRVVKGRVPDLRGVVIVGNFPEALLIRQYYWQKRTPITLNEGKPNEEKFPQDVDYLRDRAELIAFRSDLPLADLDGRWEQVYHEPREEVPYFIAVFPEGAAAADGVSSHVEFGTDGFEDFFFINDGKWTMEDLGQGKRRFRQLPQENDECGPADLALPNPLSRPGILVSRINAYHAGVEPKPGIVGAGGERLLDKNGLPQAVTFAAGVAPPRGISVWEHSERTERQLLVEYFERNHRYRTGGYPPETRKPASLVTADFPSEMPAVRAVFPEWQKFDEPGYDLSGDQATLLGCIQWLKRPAVLRFLKAHSDPWGSALGETKDVAALDRELGVIRVWVNEGNRLVPGIGNRGKLDFAVERTLWANKLLPDCATFYIHTGCESIAPAGAYDRPYNHPDYGYWQGAESLLFYCNGLALVGRSKVFYDEPREFCETLAQGGTFGDAWARYFTVESSATNVDDVGGGIGRKRAYFWSVLGDWTLRLMARSAP